MKLVALLVI